MGGVGGGEGGGKGRWVRGSGQSTENHEVAWWRRAAAAAVVAAVAVVVVMVAVVVGCGSGCGSGCCFGNLAYVRVLPHMRIFLPHTRAGDPHMIS